MTDKAMTMKIVNRASAILMVCLIIFVCVKRYLEGSKLNKVYKFTIATVYKISTPVDGGPDAEFEYCVNQVSYKNYAVINTVEKQKVAVGDKFLLKYYPPNPKIARIQLDEPVGSSHIAKMSLITCDRK